MWVIIKLKDVNIIEQAAKMVRDKFNIDLVVTQCSIEAGSWPVMSDTPIYLRADPKLKIALTVTKDHDGWGRAYRFRV